MMIRFMVDYAFSFLPVKKDKINLYYKNNSGSNTQALYKKIPKKIKNKYDIQLCNITSLSLKNELIKMRIHNIINHYNERLRAKISITTYNTLLSNHRSINLELWNGSTVKE